MNIIFLAINIKGVLLAGGIVGGTGLIIGLLLGLAAKKLSVPTDTRAEAVREQLVGSNCGGCGYAGCDACAEAIVRGDAPVNACAGANIAAIAEIMGTEAEASVRMTAFVHCSGTCDRTVFKYRYKGIPDCRKLALIPGHGEKTCRAGCMGYGSCVRECRSDAIHIVNGVARVDKEKCIACGACIRVCPNGLIELKPYDGAVAVACSSTLKGRDVKAQCLAGCIGCGICAKQCETGAVVIENNLPRIDASKCIGCGKCAEKCPSKVIIML